MKVLFYVLNLFGFLLLLNDVIVFVLVCSNDTNTQINLADSDTIFQFFNQI